MTAIELTGTVNENHQIEFDEPLPLEVSKRVRVIVLYEDDDSEISKQMRVAKQVMTEDKNLLQRLAE